MLQILRFCTQKKKKIKCDCLLFYSFFFFFSVAAYGFFVFVVAIFKKKKAVFCPNNYDTTLGMFLRNTNALVSIIFIPVHHYDVSRRYSVVLYRLYLNLRSTCPPC